MTPKVSFHRLYLTLFLFILSSPFTSSQPSGCVTDRSENQDITGGNYALKGTACAVHDPSIAFDQGRYYIFSTDTGPQGNYNGNLLIRCVQPDNVTMEVCGEIFHSLNDIPWYKQYAPTATNIWAPDVSYFNGLWHIYYAISEFGKENSVIGLVTRSHLDPSTTEPWKDNGPVYWTNGNQGFNAIDPSLIMDTTTNQLWMVFGSFWNGIQLVQMNSTTGLVANNSTILNVANRQLSTDAIEGSFLVYRQGYYYLFVSWDFCCRGANSNYEVRVGRSTVITGPYVDEQGVSLMNGGGSYLIGGKNSAPPEKKSSNYAPGFGWAAGGGESILRETVNDNVTQMVIHAYDGVSGDPYLNWIGLTWDSGNDNTWPRAVPLST